MKKATPKGAATMSASETGEADALPAPAPTPFRSPYHDPWQPASANAAVF